MFEKYECLTLPPPSPSNNVTCRAPVDSVVNGIDQSYLAKSWYVTHGFNRDYDCFACQLLSFEFPKDEPIFYNALYDLMAVNGSMIWNDIVMRGNEDIPGVMTLKGHDSGFDNVQNWYVLMQSDDTMLVYYCGDLMTWHFEGALVMSKTPILDPASIN